MGPSIKFVSPISGHISERQNWGNIFSGKKTIQYYFPKRMGGGSKAIWNFAENSSVLVTLGFPKHQPLSVGRSVTNTFRFPDWCVTDKWLIYGWYMTDADTPTPNPPPHPTTPHPKKWFQKLCQFVTTFDVGANDRQEENGKGFQNFLTWTRTWHVHNPESDPVQQWESQ